MATHWISPVTFPLLSADEVHVWQVPLRSAESLTEDLLELLSGDETARARRFIREEHGAKFATVRTALRRLLGRYLNEDPAALTFALNEHGKPDLDPAALRFNVSHSEDIGLIAIHPDRALGVDVEQYRDRLEADKIARRYFSPREVDALFALPESEQEAAFYRCWSRKEAYMKADGRGLALGLNNFDVAFGPGETPALLRAPGGDTEVTRWAVHALPVGERYGGALVIEKPDVQVQTFTYTCQ